MTIFVPSGEKHTLLISLEWPFNGSPILVPVSVSQIMARLSLPPVTIYLPSREKHTLLIPPLLPLSSLNKAPVSASKILASPSLFPVTIQLPSGEKQTLVI